jgi:hypothetical protein
MVTHATCIIEKKNMLTNTRKLVVLVIILFVHCSEGFSTTASLSQARDSLAAAGVNDLVLFGGGENYYCSDRVDIYNATSGIWSTASLSVVRSDLAAASVKDVVLFGGGYNDTTF